MTITNMKYSKHKESDVKFRRGYRFGLLTATKMLARYSEYYADNLEVKRILTIIAGEVPRMGMSLRAPLEDEKGKSK